MKIKRYDGNPILGPEPDCEWGAGQSRNPGVVYDGEFFHMVFTGAPEESRGNPLYLGYAKSKDGFNFERNEEPFLAPSEREGDFDWGTVEDTRITKIEDTYYIAYAGRAVIPYKQNFENYVVKNIPNNNPTWTRIFRRVGLLATKDFKTYEKLGPITSEFLSDANVALFPEKINGQYAMVHRPTPFLPGNHDCHYCPGRTFIAFSDDLLNWFENTDAALNSGVDNDHLLLAPEQKWEEQK
ncbi:MAG: glycoside hydrolase family 130 protein, partial [Planctomycetota bacterium]